ncbi:hypothetical protein HG531_012096 [Fusarium graminearum]|nr:hypothetical protein HG531_012096 [Fusarium graminearum]
MFLGKLLVNFLLFLSFFVTLLFGNYLVMREEVLAFEICHLHDGNRCVCSIAFTSKRLFKAFSSSDAVFFGILHLVVVEVKLADKTACLQRLRGIFTKVLLKSLEGPLEKIFTFSLLEWLFRLCTLAQLFRFVLLRLRSQLAGNSNQRNRTLQPQKAALSIDFL